MDVLGCSSVRANVNAGFDASHEVLMVNETMIAEFRRWPGEARDNASDGESGDGLGLSPRGAVNRSQSS